MTKNPITIAPDAPVRETVNILYGERERAPCGGWREAGRHVTVWDMLGLLNQLLADGESASGAT